MLINAPIARQFFASLAIPSVPSVLYPFVFCGLLEIVWNSTRARWHIWFLKWWSKSLQCSSPEQFSDTLLLVRQIFCVGCMQFMPSATLVASYSNRWPATATRRWALEESSETQAPRSGQNRTSTNNFISTYLWFLCLPADRTARRSILVLPRGFAPGTWLIIIDEQWQSRKNNQFLFAWQGHLLEGWPRLHTKGEAAWRTGRTRTFSCTPLSYNTWHWLKLALLVNDMFGRVILPVQTAAIYLNWKGHERTQVHCLSLANMSSGWKVGRWVRNDVQAGVFIRFGFQAKQRKC